MMNDRRRLYKLFFIIGICILLTTFVVSCDDGEDDTGKIGVVVTLLPQAQFVEEVGGDRVAVTVMVPPGASPHTYEPIPSQMVAVAEADLYAKVGSGVEFELVWLDNLIDQNADMLVVDCSKGIELIEMSTSYEHEGESDEHEHESMDPHIWMSPKNAMTMVNNICDGLIQTDPSSTDYYESNRDAYLAQLSEIDDDLESSLIGVSNRTFMVYHPAFGYLAHDYNLRMLSVEEEGKEPTAAGLAHLIDQAKEHGIKVVFAEPQFDPSKAETIADAIGGTVVMINPLAEDYAGNLSVIKEALIQAME